MEKVMSDIVWTGPKNNKTARWEGLVLRAEMMDHGAWWWLVRRLVDAEIGQWLTVGDCWDHEGLVKTGKLAREAAEAAARKYVEGRDE